MDIQTEQKLPLWNRNYTRTWIANFMLYVSFMLIVPILPLYLADTYGAGKHTIGFVLSGYTIAIMLVRPFSGYIVDTFDRRKAMLVFYAFAFLICGFYLIGGSLLFFTIVRTIHGAPYGASIIANSTVAIDSLYPSRRAEGIGYYGLSNNVATAISPSIGIFVYELTSNFMLLFVLSMLCSGIGLYIASTIHVRKRRPSASNTQQNNHTRMGLPPYGGGRGERFPKIGLDRFFLKKGWRQAVIIGCFGLSYGVLSTYLAIYGRETLGITGGTGVYFALLSAGLILSRIQGGKALREGKVTQNAAMGISVSVFGYILFAAVPSLWAYYLSAIIIGLGNGHMFPAVQTMFINLARSDQRGTANSTLYSSWDLGSGIGVFFGGILAESFCYGAAFWMGALVNAFGVFFFWAFVRKSYERDKLR